MIAPTIDLPAALFRGRYAKPVVEMEHNGIPVDVEYLHDELEANWQALRMFYIRRDDEFGLYDDDGSFCTDRMEDLVKAKGWTTWPRTATGRLELKSRTIGKQARHHPELRKLQKLRDTDRRAQTRRLPQHRRRGWLQPDRHHAAVDPDRTQSTLGAEQGVSAVTAVLDPRDDPPPRGWGIAALDWSAQEIGIGAGLCGDPALIADFQSGDPHMRFAIRAGLAPEWATKRSHGPVRDAVKPISLGVNYGMSKYGAAAATGKSLLWAAETLARHRHAYPVFAQWQQDTVTQALFDERIVSPLGLADGGACRNQQTHVAELPAPSRWRRLHAARRDRRARGRDQDHRGGARCVLDRRPVGRAR